MSKLNALSLSSSAARNRLAPSPFTSAAKTRPASPESPGLARAANRGTPAKVFKDGFDGAIGKAPQTTAANGDSMPKATDTRPSGDSRSAADIVKDAPVLSKLGRQKDIKFDQLCKQTGVDPKLDLKDSRQNPDAVYRMAKVLEYID